MQSLGFIGMGLMGVPMSRRLLAAGYDLMVWNRSADKCAPLAAAGAKQAADLAALCAHSEVIMLCIANTDVVAEVTARLLPHLRAGQVIVDFSSIAPDVTRALAAQVNTKGVAWVDCPVSGGVAGAEAGSLAMMAGGDARVIDQLRPLLANLSARVTHMGPNGAGQTSKICNQMIVSCNVLVMAEVLALAEKSGVDATQIPAALKGGFADSIPLQLTGTRMAAHDFAEVKWHVKTLLKDLDMANALAKEMGSAIPMAGLGAELMRLHGSKGNLEKDPSTLIEMYAEKK
ncbi:MAG: NAD(P)-dependent oxidoreductase [Oceanospirillaceae bacterium]|nr:NAD(P)-dependent oxidoreductase [Oceanospirillaceae bacterium]MCP5334592.1 NAD(P)-dependent oxidoreductase [Oceanospirillaceae bacterium]